MLLCGMHAQWHNQATRIYKTANKRCIFVRCIFVAIQPAALVLKDLDKNSRPRSIRFICQQADPSGVYASKRIHQVYMPASGSIRFICQQADPSGAQCSKSILGEVPSNFSFRFFNVVGGLETHPTALHRKLRPMVSILQISSAVGVDTNVRYTRRCKDCVHQRAFVVF